LDSGVSLGSMIVATEEQVSSDLGDEVAILDFKAGMYYGLDSVGARVWHLIQQPRIAGEIRDILISEYDVDPDQCERDLITLLQRLEDEGLIKVSDEEPA
jgi:Coenzyme PQQ synthesis protein D (PqqD)